MTMHKITIITPTFHRPTGEPGPSHPPDVNTFDELRTMSTAALLEMGMRQWNKPDDPEDEGKFGEGLALLLFPAEWYNHIPEGYEIVDIFGRREPFEPGVTDDDMRYGCLAYGILVGQSQ